MKIAVIGTGYVGLVTGTCLAELGNAVTCLDIDERKVTSLKRGFSPIYEPDLETYIKRNMEQGRLDFTTDAGAAVAEADVVFMALPTPPNEDGSADLSYILKAAEQIGLLLKSGAVVVNKSTVPAGTAEKVEDVINRGRNDQIDVASNPEFLREGLAVRDFFQPDRVVIGTGTEHAKSVMQKLYEPLEMQGAPVLFMDRTSAELAKYAANSFLATKISFMNEIANLCERLGADVDAVREAVGSDSRIGPKFLFPGIGYGGSCFPKDLIGLVRTAEENGQEIGIVKATIAANEQQRLKLVDKVIAYFGGNVSGKHFALWGLAFKPDTDDIREAPSRMIVERLTGLGATVCGYDPEAASNMKRLFEDNASFAVSKDQYGALEGADALLIATEWHQFSEPDFSLLKLKLKTPLIFDGRNMYSAEDIKSVSGIRYESIGRKVIEG